MGYLSPLGVLTPPWGGALLSDLIARCRGGQPTLETLAEKLQWQALVPWVHGTLSAWASNEFGPGIAPLNGDRGGAGAEVQGAQRECLRPTGQKAQAGSVVQPADASHTGPGSGSGSQEALTGVGISK